MLIVDISRDAVDVPVNPADEEKPWKYIQWNKSYSYNLRKLPRATTNVQKNKSYVGLFISYVGLFISYVGLIKSYVALLNSYVGLYNSYVGDKIS